MVIRDTYRCGQRTLPAKPPMAFVRRAWCPFAFKDGSIDRKAYELCALSELGDRLRASDRRVGRWKPTIPGFRYLVRKPTFEIWKGEGPLPLEIETDIDPPGRSFLFEGKNRSLAENATE